MSEARNVQTPNSPVIPDKLYFRIGEVARLLEVEAHTLRFWEGEFPQLKVGKGGTGQRLYRRRDVELAFEIKHLLYKEGYTIPGARQFLQTRQRRKEPLAPAPPPAAPLSEASHVREGPLHQIRAELRQLSRLLSRPPAHGPDPVSASAPPRSLPLSPPRRGLHLASRPPRSKEAGLSSRPDTARTVRGLFDTEPD